MDKKLIMLKGLMVTILVNKYIVSIFYYLFDDVYFLAIELNN